MNGSYEILSGCSSESELLSFQYHDKIYDKTNIRGAYNLGFLLIKNLVMKEIKMLGSLDFTDVPSDRG